jgi:hypothetical protein
MDISSLEPGNEQAYYSARRDRARGMAAAAADPAIRMIHTRMAERYEMLAERGMPRIGRRTA